MSTPKYKQILEWLDAVIDGPKASANNIEPQANSVKPGVIITLTHAIPSDKPSALPTPPQENSVKPGVIITLTHAIPSDEPTSLPTPPQAQTSPSSTKICGVSAPTPLISNLPQLQPSGAASPLPPSVSPVSSASSSASSLSSASSISTDSEASTPPPPPLPVASQSRTSGLVWPTGLSAATSVTLPYLPSTTFATRTIGTSLAGLPATANPNNPNRPSEENKGALVLPGQTGEVRDSSRAIGIVFGSLTGVAALVLGALIFYKCRRRRRSSLQSKQFE